MFFEVRFTTWLNYEKYFSGYIYLNALKWSYLTISYRFRVSTCGETFLKRKYYKSGRITNCGRDQIKLIDATIACKNEKNNTTLKFCSGYNLSGLNPASYLAIMSIYVYACLSWFSTSLCADGWWLSTSNRAGECPILGMN